VWRFGCWAALGAIAWQWLHYWPIVWLKQVAGTEAVGHFAAARYLSQPVAIAGTAFVAIAGSHAARLWESGSKQSAQDLWQRWLVVFGGALIGVAIVAAIFRDYIVAVLGPRYASAVTILPGLLWFFSLVCVNGFVAVQFALAERNHLLLWAWMAGVLVSLWAGQRMMLQREALWRFSSPAEAAAWIAVVGMLCATLVVLLLATTTGWRPRLSVVVVLVATAGCALPALEQIACLLMLCWAWLYESAGYLKRIRMAWRRST